MNTVVETTGTLIEVVAHSPITHVATEASAVEPTCRVGASRPRRTISATHEALSDLHAPIDIVLIARLTPAFEVTRLVDAENALTARPLFALIDVVAERVVSRCVVAKTIQVSRGAWDTEVIHDVLVSRAASL